ncbi:MAG: polysaccharide biosynthesis/export family protein [Bacteroidales bacterium]|jgi:polysaccharide export outer membrane protein|nr:polysaccharide biosynthesis/export family protein [Bacteroidales bacterium]
MKTNFKITLKAITGLMMIIFLMSSCVSQKKIQLLQEKSVDDVSSGFVNARKTEYKLQPGDQLYINVHSVDPKTSRLFQTDFPNPMTNTYQNLNSYRIDEDGYVNFSFIDKLYVKGLTIKEANELLQKTVNEYFKEATVIVKLVNYRVSVLGEVDNPGTFIIENKQINILQAVAQAGGPTNFGNVRKVKLVRQTLQGSEMYYLDLTDNGLLQSDQYYLLPNDVVYVEPLKSKSFAFENFPYSIILSTISTAAIVIALFK